jgi:hypothetical protein
MSERFGWLSRCVLGAIPRTAAIETLRGSVSAPGEGEVRVARTRVARGFSTEEFVQFILDRLPIPV